MTNGVFKKDLWCDVVSALNRRLGSSYKEAVVMSQFKNMKSDFKMLYELSNKSVWGWDENMRIPMQVMRDVMKSYRSAHKWHASGGTLFTSMTFSRRYLLTILPLAQQLGVARRTLQSTTKITMRSSS